MNEKLTPIQAIRKKCLECSNGQYNEIRDCLINTCPLFAFRTGDKYLKKSDSKDDQIKLDFINIVDLGVQ